MSRGLVFCGLILCFAAFAADAVEHPDTPHWFKGYTYWGGGPGEYQLKDLPECQNGEFQARGNDNSCNFAFECFPEITQGVILKQEAKLKTRCEHPTHSTLPGDNLHPSRMNGTCVCDVRDGYQLDSATGKCTLDVDECVCKTQFCEYGCENLVVHETSGNPNNSRYQCDCGANWLGNHFDQCIVQKPPSSGESACTGQLCYYGCYETGTNGFQCQCASSYQYFKNGGTVCAYEYPYTSYRSKSYMNSYCGSEIGQLAITQYPTASNPCSTLDDCFPQFLPGFVAQNSGLRSRCTPGGFTTNSPVAMGYYATANTTEDAAGTSPETTSTATSYTGGVCVCDANDGYVASPNNTCTTDFDECACGVMNDCYSHHQCNNSDLATTGVRYYCGYPSQLANHQGMDYYPYRSGSWRDINECRDPNFCGNDNSITCRNRHGSFECQCPHNHLLWNETTRECEKKEDVCTTKSYPCGQNTAGVYKCVESSAGHHCACQAGYEEQVRFVRNGVEYTPEEYALTFDGLYDYLDYVRKSECVDIDECFYTEKSCGLGSSECTNFEGGFTCTCLSGFYKGGSNEGCIDFDECHAGTASCPSWNGGRQQACKNTPGRYECVDMFQVKHKELCLEVTDTWSSELADEGSQAFRQMTGDARQCLADAHDRSSLLTNYQINQTSILKSPLEICFDVEYPSLMFNTTAADIEAALELGNCSPLNLVHKRVRVAGEHPANENRDVRVVCHHNSMEIYVKHSTRLQVEVDSYERRYSYCQFYPRTMGSEVWQRVSISLGHCGIQREDDGEVVTYSIGLIGNNSVSVAGVSGYENGIAVASSANTGLATVKCHYMKSGMATHAVIVKGKVGDETHEVADTVDMSVYLKARPQHLGSYYTYDITAEAGQMVEYQMKSYDLRTNAFRYVYQISVDSCYLAPTSNPYTHNKYYVLRNRCDRAAEFRFNTVDRYQVEFQYPAKKIVFQDSGTVTGSITMHCKYEICKYQHHYCRDNTCNDTADASRHRRDTLSDAADSEGNEGMTSVNLRVVDPAPKDTGGCGFLGCSGGAVVRMDARVLALILLALIPGILRNTAALG